MNTGFVLGWIRLDELFFLHEVDAFRDYILKSEKSIKEIQTTFEKDWDEEVAKDPDAEDGLHMRYDEEISKTFSLVPHIAFSSLYISLSSLFESSMKKACNTISHPTLAWKDMSGNSDFERVRSFLRKVALIDLTTIEKPWQKVKTLYKLRNRIVHHGSKVDVDDDSNIKEKVFADLFIQYPSSLSLKTWGEFLVIGTEILLDYLETIKEVIIGLYRLLQERLKLIHSMKNV